MLSKKLPNKALDPVSHHRASHLARHDKAKPRFQNGIHHCKAGKMPAPDLFTVGEYPRIVPFYEYPRGLGEWKPVRHKGIFYRPGMESETVRQRRPRRRRAATILRPAGVAMRARNPWVRTRFVFEG